ACFDKNWTWERGSAHAKIGVNKSAVLAVLTKPITSKSPNADLAHPKSELEDPGSETPSWFDYETERNQCIQTWQRILAGAMKLEIPEPYANNAWRQLLIQNFALINGNRMHYSPGNQYDHPNDDYTCQPPCIQYH